LLPLVYDELRRLAQGQLVHERPGQTLQATALVHEAYVRLVGSEDLRWESRAHFFAAAARAMRRILVDRARKRQTQKHGGDRDRVPLDELADLANEPRPERLLALDRLEQIEPRKAQIVMLHYFAGLTIDETAQALGISLRTVTREWLFARTWLYGEMTGDD
jgi:RNA polymerase sigma factor (TIGR02999 family)